MFGWGKSNADEQKREASYYSVSLRAVKLDDWKCFVEWDIASAE
jgi:hypothetical protein